MGSPKSTCNWVGDWTSVEKLLNVISLNWRHNGRDGVSNHQPHHCLLDRLFRRRSKKKSNSASLAFVREFTGDRSIPAQMASNAENVSIWLRHHVDKRWLYRGSFDTIFYRKGAIKQIVRMASCQNIISAKWIMFFTFYFCKWCGIVLDHSK